MAERNRDEVREREIIVTDNAPPERSGLAGLVAVLIGIAAVVLVIWLVAGSGVFDGDGEPAIPDEVDININDGDGGGDDGGDGGGT